MINKLYRETDDGIEILNVKLYNDEGDEIVTYIKSHVQQGQTFFYIVVCMKKDQNGGKEEILLPIVSFPSIDPTLYQKYKKGEMVSGQIKN